MKGLGPCASACDGNVVITQTARISHYGHVNNVADYSFFDTAVNGFLVEATGVDIRELTAIGVVAESSCRCLSGVSFPDTICAGLEVERAGRTSVVYHIAIFRGDEDDKPY